MGTSRIPIRNVYYLLSYAWDALEESRVVDITQLDSDELVDLLAHVLIGGVNHLVRRGIDRDYQPHVETLSGIRGKVELIGSARRLLFQHGLALCEFDEFTPNTLPNQIVRATFRRLAGVPGLDRQLAHQLRELYRVFAGVDDRRITAADFRRVRLHANNRYYRFMLNVCELAFDATLPDEATGEVRFRDFLRDDTKMAKLFERFVMNLYRRHRSNANPRVEFIDWRATGDAEALALLPRMKTDISLSLGSTKLIIDTKYYQETLSSYYDTQKIHSGNLYQVLTYLSHATTDSAQEVAGMLLYPTVDRQLDLAYWLGGHVVRVCTVDLSRPWKEIEERLLSILETAGQAPAGCSY